MNLNKLLKNKPLAQHPLSSCWASVEQKRSKKTDLCFLATWSALACELIIILWSYRLSDFLIKHMLIDLLNLDLEQHPILLAAVKVK